MEWFNLARCHLFRKLEILSLTLCVFMQVQAEEMSSPWENLSGAKGRKPIHVKQARAGQTTGSVKDF